MDKINLQTINEVCGTPVNAQIVIFDDIKRAYDERDSKQFLVEGFLFGMILQGSARIIIDNEEYCLSRGDLFGCNPRNILERSMLSLDLKAFGFFVTPEYVAKLLSHITVDWSFLMMANTREILHADDAELDRLVDYTNLLRKKQASPDTTLKQDSIDMLIQSMGLEIFEIRKRDSQTIRQTAFSPAENLVQRFLLMLTESSQQGKPYLNVNGYAERLHVSAKYFSLVCKKILAKTASETINEDIMRTAMALLRDNGLSIKQISDRLGFANQSHFGTFFRRHSGGKSPQDVRRNGM